MLEDDLREFTLPCYAAKLSELHIKHLKEIV